MGDADTIVIRARTKILKGSSEMCARFKDFQWAVVHPCFECSSTSLKPKSRSKSPLASTFALRALSALTLGIFMNNAHALSVDRKIALFESETTVPESTELGADGSIVMAVRGMHPSVVKLDRTGKIIWSYDGAREQGIDKRFASASPLSDGSVIVCVRRDSMPGSPLKRYPGAVLKLDSSGKEVAKFDPIDTPEDKWPFWSALYCAKWGDGVLLLTSPQPPNVLPVFIADGEKYGQNLAFRLRADLSVAWSRPIPAYRLVQAVPPRPRGLELSNGNLALFATDRTLIVNGDGKVLNIRRSEFCVPLIANTLRTGISVLCRLSLTENAWEVMRFDNELRLIDSVRLQNSATGYGLSTAAELPNGQIAVAGLDKRQKADLLLFDSSGRFLGNHHFPEGMEFRSDELVLDVLPVNEGALVVTESFQSGKVTSVLTWLNAR